MALRVPRDVKRHGVMVVVVCCKYFTFNTQTSRFIGRVRRLETSPNQTVIRPEVDGHDISARLDDVRGRVASTEDSKRRRPGQRAVVYLTQYTSLSLLSDVLTLYRFTKLFKTNNMNAAKLSQPEFGYNLPSVI